MIQNNVSSIPPNPFDVEDKEKGWKHFLENSRPISKSEAFQKMKIVNQIENRLLLIGIVQLFDLDSNRKSAFF